MPLSSVACAILDEARALNSEETVFSMTANAITQAMEQARKLAGIEDLHFHDLRHEGTSRLFENTDSKQSQGTAPYRCWPATVICALIGWLHGWTVPAVANPWEKKEEAPKKRGRPRK